MPPVATGSGLSVLLIERSAMAVTLKVAVPTVLPLGHFVVSAVLQITTVHVPVTAGVNVSLFVAPSGGFV